MVSLALKSAASRTLVALGALIGTQSGLALPGCAPTNASTKVSGSNSRIPAQGSNSAFSASKTTWESEIWSPRYAAAPAGLEAMQQRCGRADAALAKVAAQMLETPALLSDPDGREQLDFAMRAAGVAYVWPRGWFWTAKRNASDAEKVDDSFDTWLRSFNDGGERRCGLAGATTPESTSFTAIAVDVVADVIKPLPIHVRTGQWLDLRVRLLESASDAKVVRLGPTGEPEFLGTAFDGSQVHCPFAAKRPGQWLVQVMAMMNTGPRPVADLLIFVDELPPSRFSSAPVPGESAKNLGSDVAESLFAMLNQARLEEGRKPLARDPELDRLALEHAKAMFSTGHTGHDVGDGSTRQRLEAAGIVVSLRGENVVRAPDARRAHRELWASPSHRTNILHRGFRNVGIGAFVGPDRTIWACELFAALD